MKTNSTYVSTSSPQASTTPTMTKESLAAYEDTLVNGYAEVLYR